MLMIRLQRTGKKHDPSFRVVLIDSRRAASSGSVIEVLGDYSATKKKYNLDAERIKNWISKGAKVSDTVHNYLVREKIIGGKKRDVLHHAKIKAKLAKKTPKEAAAQPAPAIA